LDINWQLELCVVLSVKRIFDFVVSFLGLLLVSPVFAIITVLIRAKLGSPVLFKQQRPGLRGEPFYLYKFRTMADERDLHGNLLPDEDRLTSVGRMLRKTSLDELPQLINVLQGNLSLVGPRPLLMQYLERYSSFHARRHEVRPGITGWAQVNGRNAISWDEKFALDVWYVDNRSFWLDLKILGMTFLKVIQSEGISQRGHVTMPEFLGGKSNKNVRI